MSNNWQAVVNELPIRCLHYISLGGWGGREVSRSIRRTIQKLFLTFTIITFTSALRYVTVRYGMCALPCVTLHYDESNTLRSSNFCWFRLCTLDCKRESERCRKWSRRCDLCVEKKRCMSKLVFFGEWLFLIIPALPQSQIGTCVFLRMTFSYYPELPQSKIVTITHHHTKSNKSNLGAVKKVYLEIIVNYC